MYPPLARQARIMGTVVLDVTVASNGSVSDAHVVSGHPLLQQTTIDGVKKWLFVAQPGEARAFQLKVEFAVRGATFLQRNLTAVAEPLHLVILANGVPLETGVL